MIKYLGLNPINIEGDSYENTRGISKFVKVKIDGSSYSPILSASINHWGIEDKDRDKSFSKIQERSNYLSFTSKSKNINLRNKICGYPSIRLGKGPWDKFGGWEIGKVKDFSKINIITKWDWKYDGYANFVYDIWLKKNKNVSLDSEDIELMLWIDYSGEIDYWEDMGNFKGLKVKYKRKNKEWNKGGRVIAFIFPKDKKHIKFDLIEIIRFCEKKIKNISNYWIRSIELGTEFGKDTKVDIKLKQLNLHFLSI